MEAISLSKTTDQSFHLSFMQKNFQSTRFHNDRTGNSVSAVQAEETLLDFKLSIKEETQVQLETQSGIFSMQKTQSINIDLSMVMFKGRSVTNLSRAEAKELTSDKGAFGIEETANRILGFAISRADNDAEKIKEARKAIFEGFKEAGKKFDDKMPEISHKTIEKVFKKIDKLIRKLGGSVLEIDA